MALFRIALTTLLLSIPWLLPGCASQDSPPAQSQDFPARDLYRDMPYDLLDTFTDPDSGAEDAFPLGDLGDGHSETPIEAPSTGSGSLSDPFTINSLPFIDTRDTGESPNNNLDSYACAPDTDESGPEYAYVFNLSVSGLLMISVDDDSGDMVDPDIHLLSSPSPDDCIARDNIELAQWVEVAPGELFLVVDTWVNSANEALSGPYTVQVDLVPLPAGDCAMENEAIEMYNLDDPLPMPAFGKVAREAHLVTLEEFTDSSWPLSGTDGIHEHYLLSESITGYEMSRNQSWAPEGEGGSEWGQGSTSRPPASEEAWYVNMYWRNRPDRGTRMLLYNPFNQQAVVTSGGYETGPGSTDFIGGACEEALHALDAGHGSSLVMGFLLNQSLPLGPIDCF